MEQDNLLLQSLNINIKECIDYMITIKIHKDFYNNSSNRQIVKSQNFMFMFLEQGVQNQSLSRNEPR